MTSLWFIPGTIVGLSIAVAFFLVELSDRIDAQALTSFPRLFGVGAAGSRDMLSTIAGSVITVAGVTFSITIAALALASAQYTPRVLRTFMGDRANQIVLGSFVGIFSYCLVVLRTIRGGDENGEGAFVPSIAVLGGFLLALVGVGVLIFFIHHIAAALQASAILDRVRRTTEQAIADHFPEAASDVVDDDGPSAPETQPLADADWRKIAAMRTGYVQGIDTDGLLAFARERALVIRLERGVGDFVTEGAAVVSVAPWTVATGDRSMGQHVAQTDVRTLNGLFTINAHRTVEQDPAFGVQQIVDIALKALSPGINDTTTAVTCVDHLGAVLSRAAERRVAPQAREETDRFRVIAAGLTFTNLVAIAFDDIRRHARGNVTVLERLLDAVEGVADFTRRPDRRSVLAAQIELLAEAVDRCVDAPIDRARLFERVRVARTRFIETVPA